MLREEEKMQVLKCVLLWTRIHLKYANVHAAGKTSNPLSSQTLPKHESIVPSASSEVYLHYTLMYIVKASIQVINSDY